MTLSDLTLADLVNIAIIVQALLVIVSIYFVWRQLRESTRVTRAANTQALVAVASGFYLQVIQDPDVSRIWQQGQIEWDKLSETDKFRFRHMLLWWLIFHENIYYQWKRELIDKETYTTWASDFENFFVTQSLRQCWKDLLSTTSFQPSFVDHLQQLMRKNEAVK